MQLSDKLKGKIKQIKDFSSLFSHKVYTNIYKELEHVAGEFSQMLIDEQVKTGYDFLSDLFNSFKDEIPAYAFNKCDFKGLTLNIPSSITKVREYAFYYANNFKLNSKKLNQKFEIVEDCGLCVDYDNQDQFEDISLIINNPKDSDSCVNRKVKKLHLYTANSGITEINLSELISLFFHGSSYIEDIEYDPNKIKLIADDYDIKYTGLIKYLKSTFPKLNSSIIDSLVKHCPRVTPDDVKSGVLHVNAYKKDVYDMEYPDINSIEVDENNPVLSEKNGCLLLYFPEYNTSRVCLTTSNSVEIKEKIHSLYIHHNLKKIIFNNSTNMPHDISKYKSSSTINDNLKIIITEPISKEEIIKFSKNIRSILEHWPFSDGSRKAEFSLNLDEALIPDFLRALTSEVKNKYRKLISNLFINNTDYINQLLSNEFRQQLYKVSFTSGNQYYLCFGKIVNNEVDIRIVPYSSNLNFNRDPQCLFKTQADAEHAAEKVFQKAFSTDPDATYKVYKSISADHPPFLKLKNNLDIAAYITKEHFDTKYSKKKGSENLIVNEQFDYKATLKKWYHNRIKKNIK